MGNTKPRDKELLSLLSIKEDIEKMEEPLIRIEKSGGDIFSKTYYIARLCVVQDDTTKATNRILVSSNLDFIRSNIKKYTSLTIRITGLAGIVESWI